MGGPTLSVCIVHWNTVDDLVRCLDALAAFPYTLGATQVIVVDNASGDGAAEIVRKNYPQITLIANGENRCYAEATNQAMDVATGAYLLWLNPDARVTGGALNTLVEFLVTRPEYGAVAPKLVWPDGRAQKSVRDFPTPKRFFADLLKLPSGSLLPTFDYSKPGDAPQPMASCLLLRRSVWDSVGPMDERFPLYFNDVDWCLRAKTIGVRIAFTPNATVVHDHGGTTNRIRKVAVWESRRAWLRFWKKHFPHDPLRHVAAPILVVDAWRRAGRWLEPLGQDGGETTPAELAARIADG